MNYRSIARRGWPIDSGAVESACRQKPYRFKRAGQFWMAKGLRRLSILDEARRNRHEDHLWQPARLTTGAKCASVPLAIKARLAI